MRDSSSKSVSVLLLIAILVTGCAEMQANPKTTIGAVGGATVGGLIGAAAGGHATGIAAGVIGGMLVGGVIGNLLDDRDRRLAAEAAQKAFESTPSGHAVAWRNPDSGHSGSVTPVRTYQTTQGTYCRDYQSTVVIEGKRERATGTACRQPDGNWRIVNS